MTILQDIEEEDRPLPNLKLITGGKGPEDPIWLNDLGPGTVILVQRKNDPSFPLGCFSVIDKKGKAVHLFNSDNGKTYIWVDAVRFCRDFKLFEIILTPEELEQALEQNKMSMLSNSTEAIEGVVEE